MRCECEVGMSFPAGLTQKSGRRTHLLGHDACSVALRHALDSSSDSDVNLARRDLESDVVDGRKSRRALAVEGEDGRSIRESSCGPTKEEEEGGEIRQSGARWQLKAAGMMTAYRQAGPSSRRLLLHLAGVRSRPGSPRREQGLRRSGRRRP